MLRIFPAYRHVKTDAVNKFSTGGEQPSQQALIVLDRDGVINHDSTAFIKSPDEYIALPGSATAIAQLNDAGYTVVVATNQSGVGRGIFSLETLEKIHDKMSAIVKTVGGHIDGIYFCPHPPDANCDCRKPKPGLLQQIADQYDRTAAELIVVGDSLRDLEAAWSFGSPAMLVRTGNGQATEQSLPPDQAVTIFDDLAALAYQLTV